MIGVLVDAPSNSGLIIDPCTAVHRHESARCTNDSSCDSKDMCHPLNSLRIIRIPLTLRLLRTSILLLGCLCCFVTPPTHSHEWLLLT